MKEITLNNIQKRGNTISYDYSVSSELACYFSDEPFVIEYPEDISSVPDAIAAIPFVCNVLPLIWLADATLRVKELDESFFVCIPEVRSGYETMFPETRFAGYIHVDRVVGYTEPVTEKCAAFFSGGADAVNTLVNHLEEHPALISIWGSDIAFQNKKGWQIVHRGIEEYAQKYELPDVVIRSSFRCFDKEEVLDQHFRGQLKDGWWHGVKHGIGLLGHAAPYAYLHGISTVYIASSNCASDGHVRCASNPLTDNHVRFACARVVHDGFEYSRQDKMHNIAEYVKKTGSPLSLHVCWESQSGGNCCYCEKCYRTMAGLIAEGENPSKYGFVNATQAIQELRWYMLTECQDRDVMKRHWIHIQKAMRSNWSEVEKMPCKKYVQWILQMDFTNPDKIRIPLLYQMKLKLSSFAVYRFAHRVKVSLKSFIGRQNGEGHK